MPPIEIPASGRSAPAVAILIMLLFVTLATPANAQTSAGPIAYVSDLEGNLVKLQAFFEAHELFERGQDGKHHLVEGAWFVHGGDVPDRFYGGLQVVEELVRLKNETPDRVVLIAGNRDMNKVRLIPELSRAAMRAGPTEAIEEWQAWMETCLEADGSKTHAADVLAAETARCNVPGQRLRWILTKTMGSPDAFELRREELAVHQATSLDQVSDEAVVASFLAEVQEGGAFLNMLASSDVIRRIGNTIFVHGYIGASNWGHVPDDSKHYDDISEWSEALNRWYHAEIQSWTETATAWGGQGPRPGEPLVEYSRPSAGSPFNPQSVVYSRSLDEQGKITLPEPEVIEALMAQGIRRIVIGHSPMGETPLILRTEDDSFELIAADNSRSTIADLATRLTIEGGDQARIRVLSEVTLDSGDRLPIGFLSTLGSVTPLGYRLTDGSVVVAPTAHGYLTFQMEPRFKIVYRDQALPALAVQGLPPERFDESGIERIPMIR